MDTTECLVQPRVVFPAEVWDRLMAYVTLCQTEISGFGTVRTVPDKQGYDVIFVTDVMIRRQVATGEHVRVEAEEVSRLMAERRELGPDREKIRFQWHSHADGPVYFSATDTDFIDRWPGDWLLSLVVNHQGSKRARLDTYEGLRIGIEAQVEVRRQIDPELKAAVLADIAAKVVPGGRGVRPVSPWTADYTTTQL